MNSTVLNFGKRYEDDLRVIFDQWPKLHLGLDARSNQKVFIGIYYACMIVKLNDFLEPALSLKFLSKLAVTEATHRYCRHLLRFSDCLNLSATFATDQK